MRSSVPQSKKQEFRYVCSYKLLFVCIACQQDFYVRAELRSLLRSCSYFICGRIPDTIPFSAASEPIAEAELPDEEEEAEGSRPFVAEVENGHPTHGLEHERDIPHPVVSEARTLLHPLEAAQRSRTTTPIGKTVCLV